MAKNIPITIVAGDMDRMAAIKDGRVKVEGCDVTFFPLEPEEIFFRFLELRGAVRSQPEQNIGHEDGNKLG